MHFGTQAGAVNATVQSDAGVASEAFLVLPDEILEMRRADFLLAFEEVFEVDWRAARHGAVGFGGFDKS